MIDSHCHLADNAFAEDLDEVLQRAEEHGVEAMVTIADSLKEGRKCLEIAEKYDKIFCTIGVHPHNAKQWTPESSTELRTLLGASPKVRALGEIGLDYHYDNSPRAVQQEVFREQLTIARDLKLPAVIHCREAIADLREIICDVQPEIYVLHCCAERWEDVEDLVEQGAYLSFTGMVTFPKAEEIRRTVQQCALESILLETDAPYLAPVPHRGTRCEPAHVVEVGKKIAEIKSISLEEVDQRTSGNAVEFYQL